MAIDWSAILAQAQPAAEDVAADSLPLPEPSNSVPGTPERTEILADRVRRHLALWHPLDVRYWGPILCEPAEAILLDNGGWLVTRWRRCRKIRKDWRQLVLNHSQYCHGLTTEH